MLQRLRDQLSALHEARVAIVDLSQVTYMDSSVIAEMLLLYRQRSKAGRSAPRVVLGPKLVRMYEAAAIDQILPRYATLEDAGIAP